MDPAIYAMELTGIILLFIVGIGIVIGNCFVLAAVKLRPSLRTPLNIYVASICVSGVLTGLIAPFQAGFYIGPIHYQLPFFYNCNVRKWLAVAFWASSTNAILCMLAIAVERYRILFNRASPRNSGLVVVVIWVLAVVYDSLMFGLVEVTFVLVNSENAHEIWARTDDYSVNGAWIVAEVQSEGTNSGQITNKTKLEPELWRYPYAKNCHALGNHKTMWVYVANFLIAFALPFLAILVLYHLLSEALLGSALGPNEERSKFSKGVSKATATIFRTHSTLSTHFPPNTDTINNRPSASISSANERQRGSTAPAFLTVATLKRVEKRKMERLRAVRGMRMAVMAFFACWLPAQCMLLHAGFEHDWYGEDATGSYVGHLDWKHKLMHDIGVQVILAHNWIHLFIYPAYNKMFKAELRSLRTMLVDILCRRRRASVTESGAGRVAIHLVEATMGRDSITGTQEEPGEIPTRRSTRRHHNQENRLSGGFGKFSLVLPSSAAVHDTYDLDLLERNKYVVRCSIGGASETGGSQESGSTKRRWSTGTKVDTKKTKSLLASKGTKTGGDSGIGKSETGNPDEILTPEQLIAQNEESAQDLSKKEGHGHNSDAITGESLSVSESRCETSQTMSA